MSSENKNKKNKKYENRNGRHSKLLLQVLKRKIHGICDVCCPGSGMQAHKINITKYGSCFMFIMKN